MNPSGSKNKGRNFENKVANMLREAFPDARRVTVSGANPNDPGDVRFTFPHPWDGPGKTSTVIAECKKREKWSLDSLLRGKCVIWDWWNQAVSHCSLPDTYPVLIMAHNFSPPIILGSAFILGGFESYTNSMIVTISLYRPSDINYDLICVDLQEFINYWKARGRQ